MAAFDEEFVEGVGTWRLPRYGSRMRGGGRWRG
jgi:hypothetical protein